MQKLSYKKSGVDVDKANTFVQRIKPLVASTKRPGWTATIGGFSGLFSPPLKAYKNPVVVASTDGVGTKVMIAQWAGEHDTIGIDLVAMCVNDIVTCGAEPLFFLDYFATGKLSPGISYEVLQGIAKGCRLANCALIGGETAELPGMYKPGGYDLAGFAVGIAEKKNIIDGSKIRGGDLILGLASTGPHSNGYSLVRKTFSKRTLTTKLKKDVLAPTAIYVRPVCDLVKRFTVRGIAHITGGGFYDNIVRILPKQTQALLHKKTWPVLPIFNHIQKKGGIGDKEMYRTFNMGIGMILILSRKDILEAQERLLKKWNVRSWVIGEIRKGARKVDIV
jgi:phosphoribosylformylglycinamidine cyclo-ligase